MNTRTDNPLHVSNTRVLGDKFAICDQEGKTQGIAASKEIADKFAVSQEMYTMLESILMSGELEMSWLDEISAILKRAGGK